MSGTPADFDTCLAFVLAEEAGFVHNPKDPGGATNMGITQATLSNWRKKSVTVEDVRNLTRAEAADIYRANYWLISKCDHLPAALAQFMLDSATLTGNHRAAIFLQTALHITADGVIGPATIAAAAACSVKDVVLDAVENRLAFLQHLPTWGIFGGGWGARLQRLKAACLKLV